MWGRFKEAHSLGRRIKALSPILCGRPERDFHFSTAFCDWGKLGPQSCCALRGGTRIEHSYRILTANILVLLCLPFFFCRPPRGCPSCLSCYSKKCPPSTSLADHPDRLGVALEFIAFPLSSLRGMRLDCELGDFIVFLSAALPFSKRCDVARVKFVLFMVFLFLCSLQSESIA